MSLCVVAQSQRGEAKMHTTIKFFLAFALASAVIDLTKPDFIVSMFEELNRQNPDLALYKEAATTKEDEEMVSIVLKYAKPSRQQPPKAVVVKEEVGASRTPHMLWANTYSVSPEYPPEAMAIAERYSVEELKDLARAYRKRYHHALYREAPRTEVEKAYRDYLTYRDALEMKTR